MANENSNESIAVLESPKRAVAGAEAAAHPTTSRVTPIVLGRVVAVWAPEWALVVLKGRESAPPVRARSFAGLTSADTGGDVALMFDQGDEHEPFIIGRVQDPDGVVPERGSKTVVSLDAEAITLTGEKEIVLRCGEASITLRRDGRVVVRGAYIETRSHGVNRIKGGTVQIN